MVTTLFVVAVALIDETPPQKRVLLAQRPEGKQLAGLWEFPGGKVAPQERPEEALIRELFEELGIEVESKNLTPLTFASHAYPDFHLLMPLYICTQWQGNVHGKENQAVQWVSADELSSFAMPPADAPLLPILKSLLRT
jgi:8-oxo-dGTP diphosphatase